jgi:imidazolonepropionase
VTALLIHNTSQVLTLATGGRPKLGTELMDVGVLPGAAVAIRDGSVIAVGNDAARALEDERDVHVIDADGGLVMPGYVDPHTSCLRERERRSSRRAS